MGKQEQFKTKPNLPGFYKKSVSIAIVVYCGPYLPYFYYS